MPIINIKFIENVVATPEQKRQLIKEMTDTFVRVLGEVVHPFTYVVIEETKMYDWGIAGHPQPDLAWLTGPEYAHHEQGSGNDADSVGASSIGISVPPIAQLLDHKPGRTISHDNTKHHRTHEEPLPPLV